MKISILADNHAGSHTRAEHGLSYLIEYDHKKILFDTGQSDLFLKNADIMDVNPANTDLIILSHGHFDHGNGLTHLSEGRLICHPDCFVKRYRMKDHVYIGLRNPLKELSSKFKLEISKHPIQITERIYFLGEIPRITEFESKDTSFKFEDGTPDFVKDDSALAIIMPEGLFIITGCGHSGIVNTFEYAKRVTGISRIYGVIGGLHLKENNFQTQQTIKYIGENKVKHIFPSHCTELPALSAFHQAFGIRQVRTGDIFTF